ncbi:MAG TPA: response regulator [Gammaproteobacteria bacterium]|nr:response regulator [Gammaproteobacteria bacterium]MEC8011591.1 response regulator [Pseudomonadota bacterium]HBF09537.1 response regulator [Gammaproteobacteria bacterium]HCK92369.1 response regulator [Gammaproteobacteria bacterium]|tara:strand:- start:573 stop:932 length:360 start_codon:yes stop_codon:yes gene_type:complete
MAKILAVDDSPSIRRMVELTLDDEDHDVTTATDGQFGFEEAKKDQYDLVITDINMPNMSGYELIQALRALPEYQNIPIVCLTTESGDEQKAKGRAVGATGWITKPFSPEKLLSVVDRLT